MTFGGAAFLLCAVLASASALPAQSEAEVELSRVRRQEGGDGSNGDCDFGVDDNIDLCSWDNVDMSAFEWKPSSGDNSFWIGGPRRDKNDNNAQGGYALFETSQLPDSPDAENTVSAMMASPTLDSTGSKGYCVSFSYAMNGLSADKLRLLLQPEPEEEEDEDVETDDDLGEDANPFGFNSRPRDNDDDNKGTVFDLREHTELAELKDSTRGEWKAAQVMYSFPARHKVIFEAIPKDETDQARKYRGYVAIDDVKFESGEKCRGHCNFDAGFCTFANGEENDFDWKVVSSRITCKLFSSPSLGKEAKWRIFLTAKIALKLFEYFFAHMFHFRVLLRKTIRVMQCRENRKENRGSKTAIHEGRKRIDSSSLTINRM